MLKQKDVVQMLCKQKTEFCNRLKIKNKTPFYVPEAGLEPARPKGSQDFKSGVSTNSTIRASCCGAKVIFIW